MPAINRVAAFNDTFDSSISASYTNGPAEFATCTWQTGGYVRPTNVDELSALIRNTGVFSPNQWATVTTQVIASGENSVNAIVRGSTSSTACYFGALNGDSAGFKYAIIEIAAAFASFTELASSGTGASAGSGIPVTLEMLGADLALYTDEGSGDTQRLTASDSTITTGMPGMFVFAVSSQTDAMMTSLSTGSYFQELGDFLFGVGPYTSGTGNITPQIPTILNDAADYYPLLLAHSAGGENINLGTANGFSELANSPSATGSGTAGVKVAAFGNTSGAGGSNPVITDPGNHCGGFITLVWHPDGLAVVDATINNQKGSASTTCTIDGVTTTVANALVLPVGSTDLDSAADPFGTPSNANLSGLAKLFGGGTTQGNGGQIGLFGGIKATAGDVGDTTVSVTSSVNANYCIAFAPASSSTPQEFDGVSSVAAAPATSGTLAATTNRVYAGAESVAASPSTAGTLIAATDMELAGAESVAAAPATAGALTTTTGVLAAGAESVAAAPSTAGTLVAEIHRLFACVESVATAPATAGTLVAESTSSQVFAGVESESAAEAYAGTLAAEQHRAFAGAESLAAAPSTAGTLLTEVQRLFEGAESICVAPAESGTLVAGTTVSQQFAGVESLAQVPASSGTLVAEMARLFAGAESLCASVADAGTLVAQNVTNQQFSGAESVSPSPSSEGTLTVTSSLAFAGAESICVAPSHSGSLSSQWFIDGEVSVVIAAGEAVSIYSDGAGNLYTI